MSRSLIIVVAALVIVVGGLFVLAGRAKERPLTHVEKVVPLANLQG